MRSNDDTLRADDYRHRPAANDREAGRWRTAAVSAPRAPFALRKDLAQRALLLVALLGGAMTHGYHVFEYPLYITDEGVYMQRAWSLLREGSLSPYTYNYDHAPGGWIAIAAWTAFFPRQMDTFGMAENVGRLLMVVVHVASTYFLFKATQKLSGSLIAAVIATFFFNFSPLAIFYQREVVLDNLMAFWVLLSLYLVIRDDHRVITPLFAGLAFGISVLTKENAIFFAPALGYALYHTVHRQFNRRFALSLPLLISFAIISWYFLYAILQNELLPSPLTFSLSAPPSRHVSLLYTIWQQLHRNQGSLLQRNSPVWQFSIGAWMPKDAFLLIGGTASVLIDLYYGIRERARYHAELVAGLMGAGYLLYLARGSVMLEFYVVPLIPFLAMNLGMVVARILPLFTSHTIAQAALLGVFMMALVSPIGGYVLVRDSTGKVVYHDLYKLDLTALQVQQLQFIRSHIPPNSRIIMDEEFWVNLHTISPMYPNAHSHFEATGDPAIRDDVFHQSWQYVDYIVMSNKMRVTMQQDNTGGQYDWIFDTLDNHAQRIWMLQHGGIELEIWQVNH